MIRYENDCCGCAVPAYPCRGSSCPLRHAPHYYCDICGEELDPDDMIEIGDEHYHKECAVERGYIESEDEDE